MAKEVETVYYTALLRTSRHPESADFAERFLAVPHRDPKRP